MEKVAATRFLICSLFAVLCLFSYPANSSEVEDEREFSYDEDEDTGPSRWGEIKEEWRVCKNGTMQSPIDVLNKRVRVVSHLGALQMKYHPSNATLKNRGHDIMLEWAAGAGYLQINETQYVLRQCHWHSFSEHTIDGKRLDLELHMVHETEAGETAVIAILYKIGKPDAFLSSLTEGLKAVSDTTETEEQVGMVDPWLIKTSSLRYYRYLGSLTTPPCSENVVWTILGEVKTVAKEQVNLLRNAVDDGSEINARPLQPINNRLVELYQPKASKKD
ncbi:alpha carbonic anhydrase 7-like [Prosopis cineraria]|uniref:alpha carbonic anhydrase 7-like n=1 Tax=Prosopis cineraria TaxID=364024 RepID=UPI002410250E|nr:alpha carbonic anhydrase 7-like [Prosopis cineraria]